METLINYLLQFGHLNQQQIDLIKRKTKELHLKKDDYFSEAGKIAEQVAFIVDGIFRVCYYNNKGEEITRYFIDENNFAVDLNSFNNKIPSSEYVQAITDCKLVAFSDEALKELSLTIVGWDSIINQITAKALIEKVNRISPMMAEMRNHVTTFFLLFSEYFDELPKTKKPENIVFAGF